MRSAHNVPVLMYHHVSPTPGGITSSPENFEAHIAWLARHGYQSLSTAQFAAYLAGQPVPEKSLLITFDDGYLDNWVYAHPILQRYGMRAVLFLVTDWAGDGPVRACAGAGGALPFAPAHADCKPLIDAGRADEVIVRWSEIDAMQRAGTFEIHSHTHTHTRWDKVCASADEKCARMAEELQRSRATLVQRLGKVSDHLCWPQGYFDADYVALARQAGFNHLYTTDAFGQNTPGHDPLHIHRFAVSNRSGTWLGRRIRLAAHPVWGPLFNRWKRWKKQRRAAKSVSFTPSPVTNTPASPRTP